MPRILVRHLPRLAGLVLGVALAAGIAPTSTHAATPFAMDVYFGSGYERQVDNRTCTAASTAMMLNFIAGRDLGLSQMSILRYAQPRDALKNTVQRGSDPLGWAKALTYFDTRTGASFTYSWEAYASESEALKRAARQIAVTGKPVGLVIWNGGHAVVMTGFEASNDPRTGDFTLNYVWISDPYGSSHKRFTASGSPLDRYMELDATAAYDRAWYKKYVIVVPQSPATAPTVPAPTVPAPTVPAPTPIPVGHVVVNR
jgi:peptidase C39-like protein